MGDGLHRERAHPLRDIQASGRGVGPGRIAFEMADCSIVSATFQHARLELVGPLENQNRPYVGTPPGNPTESASSDPVGSWICVFAR